LTHYKEKDISVKIIIISTSILIVSDVLLTATLSLRDKVEVVTLYKTHECLIELLRVDYLSVNFNILTWKCTILVDRVSKRCLNL